MLTFTLWAESREWIPIKEVTIRAAKVGDLQDIHEIMSCPGVYRNISQLPYATPQSRSRLVESDSPNVHNLVAESEGKVVGHLGLTQEKYRRAHVGWIGMAVHDDYQGKGIGTKLMAAAIDTADNWLNLRRLELEVNVDNEPAIHLYEKFGFKTEGRQRCVVFRDGEYVDAYMMARLKE